LAKFLHIIFMRIFLIASFFFFFNISIFAQTKGNDLKHSIPPFLLNQNNVWVDSLMNTMSLEEKIGQLFMIAAYSNKDETHYVEIENYIKKYKIGGLIFFQGTAEKQAELTNRYQALSNTKLWIGFDGEWGLAMRLKNTVNYPRQMMLGAIENENTIYEMGAEFARQMKRIGIHINFAPDVDVNNNPNNPVINDRSFGDSKYNVTLKAKAYMRGMQDNFLLACAKHFPGHGDTDVDSHYDMPVLQHSAERLDKIELYPFKAMIRNGISSVMVAHMNVLAYDNTPNLPSTLSPKVVQQKLIDELGFNGLIFTDALNMKGVAKYFPSGIAEVKALKAGNDVMLFSEHVDAAIKGIKDAVEKGEITEERINQSVRKILLAKYWVGLNQYQPIDLKNINADINNEQANYVNTKLIQESITIVEDKHNLIPIEDVREKIAHIAIGNGKQNTFSKRIDDYCAIDHYYISKNETKYNIEQIINKTKKYKSVIVEVNDMSRFSAKNYGLTINQIEAVKVLDQKQNAITVIFGSPYSLKHFQNLHSILLAYNEDSVTQDITAQILFGARAASGTLPVTVGKYEYSSGKCSNGNLRLSYGLPIEVGIDVNKLKEIDKIIENAIANGATPSSQILVAKNGMVVYQKSFGKMTYTSSINVDNEDLYDIASLTKVVASTPIIMHAFENKKIDVNKTLGTYYSYPDSCNKSDIIIKDILAHQAGLVAWIPFYKNTLDSLGNADTTWYAKKRDNIFSKKVLENLYLRNDFVDSIRNKIYYSPLGEKKYKYSDLGYYLMYEIIEKQYKENFETVVNKYLWNHLGMNYTYYNPLDKNININNIVPTELESGFRNQLLHGTVHDQGAALMGGVAGHAGVFSNTNDLAKYFQMLLNNGYYGGTKFYNKSTIDLFTTSISSNNRRGLGFDKPSKNGESGPTCDSASVLSFGHTGFTGCIAWADPTYNLIFIQLSNRINPSADNKKFINQNIRPKIQQVIYDAILKK
jgi:beta-N-acetylhexosaminidase